MQCSECSLWTSLYLDGLLNEEQVARWQEHLTQCRACREEWECMRSLSSILAAEAAVGPVPGLASRVNARLQQREARRRRFYGSLGLMVGTTGLWAAAAMAMLTFLLVLWQPLIRVLVLEVAPALFEHAWITLVVLSKALGSVAYAISRRPTWLLLPGYVILALAITVLWTRVVLRARQPVL